MPPWDLMRYRGTSRSLEVEGEGGVEDKVDPLEWTWMDFLFILSRAVRWLDFGRTSGKKKEGKV
jgi:hypothetical protein